MKVEWQDLDRHITRARNWGLVCGFGYGFAAAVFTFLIMLLNLIAAMPVS